ncbi:MAG TPA: hypothetical protein VKY33_01575 [Flavobacterium sp.]|nr:hypothetical protein [Flavobacterium sp.]
MKKLPDKDLESIIKDSDLSSLLKDYSEIIVDSFIEEGVIKELPIIGTIIGLVNFSNSLNQHFTTKKLCKFLIQLDKIPIEKRRRKINEINSSNKYASSVGETILEILDKIDTDGKPELIGRIFAAFIEERIDYKTFLKISYIIKSIFYLDLIELRELYDGHYVNGNIEDILIIYGLVKLDMNFTEQFESSLDLGNSEDQHFIESKKPTLTQLGKLIIEIGMPK